jgi:hypothetical protein
MSNLLNTSVFALRVQLYNAISDGRIDQSVLELLLPNGIPHSVERQLWDYKIAFPVNAPHLPSNSPSNSDYDSKIAELAKDVVAFFNTLGGYIVAGIQNSPRDIVGFSGQFDCDLLNRKVKAFTGTSIETHYACLNISSQSGPIKCGTLVNTEKARLDVRCTI